MNPTPTAQTVSMAMVLIGYSSYALIFVRSAADPPIDENDPETTEAIVSYLKREQYGSTPLLTGPTYDAALGQGVWQQVRTLQQTHTAVHHWRQLEKGGGGDL